MMEMFDINSCGCVLKNSLVYPGRVPEFIMPQHVT